jgi:hypothetical protein
LIFATKSAAAAATIASARSVAIATRVLQTMTIAKLSYIGAAGLGIVLALGGVRTLAFQGPGGAKPIGLAPAAAQKSGDQVDPHVPLTPANPPDGDRNRQLASSVLAIGEDLDRAMRQLRDLQDRLRKLEAEIDPVRRDRPTGRPDPSPTSRSLEKKDSPGGSPNRPYYIYSPSNADGRGPVHSILIASPDGTWVATYDASSGKSAPLKLPPVKGIRREVLALKTTPRQRDLPAFRDVPDKIELSQGTWFFALDLDRADRVTRIAAFDIADGTWIDREIPEPVDRSSVKIFPRY